MWPKNEKRKTARYHAAALEIRIIGFRRVCRSPQGVQIENVEGPTPNLHETHGSMKLSLSQFFFFAIFVTVRPYMYITCAKIRENVRKESLESMIRHPATQDFSDPVLAFTIVS